MSNSANIPASAPMPAPRKITPVSPRASGGPNATTYRTHSCGELRKEHAGQKVMLEGAIDKVVDDKTYLVRDAHGTTLVALTPAAIAPYIPPKEIGQQGPGAFPLKRETIVNVTGTVAARAKADAAAPTGAVQVNADAIRLDSRPAKEPILDFHDDALPREQRIRHRYLYLRKPAAHANFEFRTRLLQEARRFLVGEAFEEIETPILANRWTPEQTDAYLAIRERTRAFALPGRRPIHGLLAMASGCDRVFEVGRRFQKKKSYNSWQQPEYTVLELNMAWVEEADVHKLVDRLLFQLWLHGRKETMQVPLRTLTFEEAWTRFGTDAPDARGGCEVEDVTKACERAGDLDFRDTGLRGGALRAFLVPEGAKKIQEADRAAMARLAPDPRAASVSFYLTNANGALEAVAGGAGRIEDAVAAAASQTLGGRPGDLLVVVHGWDRMAASAIAGQARTLAVKAAGLLDPKAVAPLRITELPYWRRDPKTGAKRLAGDPMTKPKQGDLEGDPNVMRQQAFYLVVNGVNVGGGSIRQHDRAELLKLCDALKIDQADVDANHQQHLGILEHGVPPSGRVSIGVDRLLALLRGLEGIDEMIPMPKMPDGTDPLTRSPWPIEGHVVRGLLGV